MCSHQKFGCTREVVCKINWLFWRIMADEIHLLDEFDQLSSPRSKYFSSFILFSASYILFIVLDLCIDLKSRSLKTLDWDLLLPILLPPVLGLFFYWIGKK